MSTVPMRVRGEELAILMAVALTLPAMLPVGAGAVPSDAADPLVDPPSAEACTSCGDWEDLTLEDARRRAEASMRSVGTVAPAPDRLDGYDELPRDAKKAAWRAWMVRGAMDRSRMEARPLPATGAPAASGSSGGDLSPRGLQAIWSVQTHGIPIEVMDGGPGDATFVWTSKGVLRVPGPGEEPAWMFRTGYAHHVETLHANDDEVPDLVVGTIDLDLFSETPSLAVVDGATGEVLWSGASGGGEVWSFTTTDVDGDGNKDILGLTIDWRLVARTVEGETLHEREIAGPPDAATGIVGLIYVPWYVNTFSDVTGDGVQDAVVSSSYYAYSVASSHQTPLVTTYSGEDGSEIWTRPLEAHEYAFVWPLATGDLTGDDASEIVLLEFGVDDASAPGTYALIFTIDVVTLEGTRGTLLSHDRRRYAYAFAAATGATLEHAPTSYFPTDVADLDRDGTSEIAGIAATYGEEKLEEVAVVGRVPSPAPGGPTREVYRHTFDVSDNDLTLGLIEIQDLDADGETEHALIEIGIATADDDRFESWDATLHVVDDGEMQETALEAVVGTYAADPDSGRIYAWTVEDDRWRPFDAGAPTGDGFRILLSNYVRETDDVTGDGVPDVLVPKTLGMTWLDGTTGEVVADRDRNLLRWSLELVREQGQLKVHELQILSFDRILSDLATGEVHWRLEWEGAWRFQLSDLAGDGRLELLRSGFEQSADGYRRWTEIVDPRTEEKIWDLDGGTVSVRIGDLLTERTGEELLLGDQEADTLTVRDLDVDEPVWRTSFQGGVPTIADDGVILIESGEDLTAIDGADGETAANLTLPEDHHLDRALTAQVTGDATPDLVLAYEESIRHRDQLSEQDHAIVVWDWRANATLGPHRLSDPLTREVLGWTFVFSPSLHRTVPDWDGDGGADLLTFEELRPVVRSSATGEVLGAAPRGTYVPEVDDVDGDGRGDLLLSHRDGRLALTAYAPGSTGEEADPMSTVQDPTSPMTHDPDAFGTEGGLLPGFEAAVLLAAVGAALVLARRRD